MAPTDADLASREQSRNFRALRGLVPFLKPHLGSLIAATIALVVTAALSLTLPLAVRRVVDGFNEDIALLDRYFQAAILVAGLLAIGTGLRFYLVTRLGERVVTDIRKTVYERMIIKSPGFFENILTGEVLSRMNTDTTLIQSVIGSSVSLALRNILIFCGGLLLMFLTSPKLTGLVLLIVPVVIVPILAYGRRVRGFSRTTQEKIAESSANASETLLAAQTVQAFTHEAQSRGFFDRLSEDAFRAARSRIIARSFMTVIVIFLVFTGIVAVLWLGTRDVRSDLMTPGTLVQFVIYAIMVAGSVAALSEIWTELQRAAGATERLVELLEADDPISDPTNGKILTNVAGNIEFSDVAFAYPSRPNQIALKEFSVLIKPGETVAFVGPSGAGKSTIFQLLMRFFDPQSGTIRLEGVDIKEMERSHFREFLAYVPQDPVIFATSAKENIRFGRPDASDDDVIAAAKAANAHEFLMDLPEGYESLVGERGVMLSGGQRQRLAIARAILRDAPILVLDEATSALDVQSERSVQHAVEALSEDRTTLVVAHRLSTVLRADRIIVLQDGRIVDQGRHEELMKREGLYADLVKLQFLPPVA
ncbi:MAG: ABC transporter transmembrane domain-containing protein [Pseudomonadota bacterium]